MKLAIILLLLSSAFAQPDAPSKLLSKPFIVAHSIYLGSIVYDNELTHAGLAHHRCVEKNINPPYPSRGDLYRHGAIEFGAVLALDLGMKALTRHGGSPRWLTEIDGMIGAGVATGVHINGGTSWLGECW